MKTSSLTFTAGVSSEVSSKGMDKNISFNMVFKNIIETFSDPTDFGHLKEIVLDAQTKRFIIENGHGKPKSKGPITKNSVDRSFLEKYLLFIL